MSRENDLTIHAYNQNIQGYIEGSPQVMPPPVIEWIAESVQGLPEGAKILEIGSGFGRDADFIEETYGFQVERTDATPNFVEYLALQGHAVSKLDIVHDDIKVGYDMVLANAVLLHLTREETGRACKKVARALHPGIGRFSLGLLQGEGDLMTLPTEDKTGASRYFCYWMPGQVEAVLMASGFETVKITPHTELGDSATWLHIIAKK